MHENNLKKLKNSTLTIFQLCKYFLFQNKSFFFKIKFNAVSLFHILSIYMKCKKIFWGLNFWHSICKQFHPSENIQTKSFSAIIY